MFNWKKLGRIFDPTKYVLLNKQWQYAKYAQSPQVLVFDDFIRIYFSTRKKDKHNKYVSHIQFVDMNKSFDIIKISNKEVIELGGLGCFDEHGIFPANIVKTDSEILAYTTGWSRRQSVPNDISIGLAKSMDGGETFQKFGDGPVLTSSPNQPFLICDAFVKIINNKYHMWYIYGTKWIQDKQPERIYKIAHATSVDGIDWQREDSQIIQDKIDQNECQALPCVIEINNMYHMFFCFRNATDFRTNKEMSYRIGYAYSSDLINWTRDDKMGGMQVSDEGWDSEMICYPHVFSFNNNVYMLYNGNHFGKFGFGLAKIEERTDV